MDPRLAASGVLAGCLFASCGTSRHHQPARPEAPQFYKATRDQAGHDLVKTEQFIVPVGSPVVVSGLDVEAPACELTDVHRRILTQVFNSLEEITENTIGDTDAARVAEYRGMTFEVRASSEGCAGVVRDFLVYLGTPPWRLSAKGARKRDGGRVAFVRTK